MLLDVLKMENYGEKWMREVWADPFFSKFCLVLKCPKAPCSGFSGSSGRKLGGVLQGHFVSLRVLYGFCGEYVYGTCYEGHITFFYA